MKSEYKFRKFKDGWWSIIYYHSLENWGNGVDRSKPKQKQKLIVLKLLEVDILYKNIRQRNKKTVYKDTLTKTK